MATKGVHKIAWAPIQSGVKKGSENRVDVALSRKSSHHLQCAAISTSSPVWLNEIMNGYLQDEHVVSMMSKLAIDASVVPNFSLVNGLLKYRAESGLVKMKHSNTS